MTALSDGCANMEYINNNGGNEHVMVPRQDEQVKVPAIDIENDHQTAQTDDAHCQHMAFDNNSKDPFSNFAFPDDHIKLPKFSGQTPWTVMSTQLHAYLDQISLLDGLSQKIIWCNSEPMA
jgi:hypothetical protein